MHMLLAANNVESHLRFHCKSFFMLNYILLHFVRNDGGVSVLGVGGLRGKGDASQVEPLAPLEKKFRFFLSSFKIPL